ncbi:MAG: TAT-variant-translocated molybdopterin oxidoreductase [Phycisphaerales bacterium]
MSNQDQCPSSKKQGKPALKPRVAPDHSAATGARFYRSIDDVADTPEFREHLEREFLPGASELNEETRREFIKIMSASLALAGVAGMAACRRPAHKILAYNKEPEDIVPGNPLFYATAMPSIRGAQGLLARTVNGRPIKLEGNPLHPNNQGKSDVFAQSAVLNLYDNDRLKTPLEGEAERTWAQFAEFASTNFNSFNASGGEGLAFLADRSGGPTRDAMRARVLERWPRARWVEYDPSDADASRAGASLAFGGEHATLRNLSRAKVVVSFADDFLLEPGALAEARGFAQGRKVHSDDAAHSTMNRLYAVESAMTLTGGNADHRLALPPSQIPGFLAALASKVMARLGAGGGLASAVADARDDAHDAWLNALADDLVANRGAAAILVGEQLPAWCHALAHAMHDALGCVGSTVSYTSSGDADRGAGVEALARLVADLNAGRVETLVILGVNAAYSAPGDLNFSVAAAKARTVVYHGANPDETSKLARWSLPESHFLEAWGDARAADGTISPIQPMIAPLFQSKSQIELLAMLLGSQDADGYDIVRNTWKSTLRQDGDAFERTWRRALHDGVVPNTAARKVSPSVRAPRVADEVRAGLGAAGSDGLELVITPHPYIRDGKHTNNPWLHETPHPITKVCWDNPVMINPETAKRLRLSRGDMVRISVGGRSAEFAVWVQPGVAENTLVVETGLGRTAGGRIAEGRGFNAYPLTSTAAMRAATGVTVEKIGGDYLLASTQNHQSMEGRDILREVDLAAWQKFGDEIVKEKDSYGNTKIMPFAARLGTESHTPLNRDVYKPDQTLEYETVDAAGNNRNVGKTIPGTTEIDQQSVRQQWGMSIDLTMCSGCGSCITACQAENNIPVVGKFEINRNRQMHWIRVDRYFADVETAHGHETGMYIQPVACVHCENAPCETVCPVNATVHGVEGTNNMAYNRCIGTRYCANNCPYKVRRFNWFDYATKTYPAEYGQIAEGLKGAPKPPNGQWIPARMREKVDLVRQMQYNPNVTVRSRGVMEKCSYCIQRINKARVESKIDPKINALGRIPDGYFQTACEQACPADAITFGDITNADSRVSQLRDHGRSYMVLAYLNTRPRTTHMVRLRNPNPAIRTPNDNPFHHGAEHHEGDHAAPAHGGEHSFLDPARKAADPGHKMSLSVLPADPSRRSALKTVIAGVLA